MAVSTLTVWSRCNSRRLLTLVWIDGETHLTYADSYSWSDAANSWIALGHQDDTGRIFQSDQAAFLPHLEQHLKSCGLRVQVEHADSKPAHSL